LEEGEEKLKVLELEKKVVELELTVEKIKKQTEGIDIRDLVQRLEDLEDLVMVENAGVIELKKYLESIPTQVEEKTKKLIEESIPLPTPLIEEIKKIKSDILMTKSEIDSMKNLGESLKSSIQEPVFKKVEEIQSKVFEVSSQLEKMEELRESLDKIKASLIKLEAETENNKKLIMNSPRMEDVQKALDELRTFVDAKLSKIDELKSQIMLNKSSVEALEKVIEQMNSKTMELEQSLKSIETLKSLSSGEIKDMFSRALEVSSAIQEFNSKLKQLDDISLEVKKINAKLASLSIEMEKIKKDTLSLAPMSSVDKLSQKIEEMNKYLSSDFLQKLSLRLSALESKMNFNNVFKRKEISPIVIE